MGGEQPVEPAPSHYTFDLEEVDDGEDLAGVGGDLRAGTLLAAYRAGLFPMGLGEMGDRPMGWWSPDPRGVLLADGLVLSRSLRRTRRRFEIRVDTAFEEVVAACADPGRDGRWITPEIAHSYVEMHRLGWAHSIEAWRDDRLVGGLYGLAIGGLFAGESMFHHETDASKAAVVAMHDLVYADVPERAQRLVDVQWSTAHLASLGVVETSRDAYLHRMAAAVRLPQITFVQGPSSLTR